MFIFIFLSRYFFNKAASVHDYKLVRKLFLKDASRVILSDHSTEFSNICNISIVLLVFIK